MKRQLNAIHWPYIGPVVLNSEKRIEVVAESLICAERHEAYVWVLQCIFKMAPRRKKETVNAIFGDCFLNSSITTSLGIHAKVFHDHYHLCELVLPDKFGKPLYAVIKQDVVNMFNATTESKCREHYDSARTKLGGNMSALTHLDELFRLRSHYAVYVIDSVQGTLKRRGSSHAEQNHSSIVNHLGSASVEDPAKQIERLLQRHQHMLVINNRISGSWTNMERIAI